MYLGGQEMGAVGGGALFELGFSEMDLKCLSNLISYGPNQISQ